MAKILVVTHRFDQFRLGSVSVYMLHDILLAMEAKGHAVHVARGIDPAVEADLAIAHVDCSRTPEAYLEYVRSFPRSVNGSVADITKRAVSGAVLDRDSEWDGPVIVKSDLNYRGIPEKRHNAAARKRDVSPPHPDAPVIDRYDIFDSPAEVPDACWGDPDRVVERFLAEDDPDGYAMRTWVFMGAKGRCRRHVSRSRIIKSSEIVRSRDVAVPDELAERRRRMGFDFGKFDFVLHEGRAVLLDANKTPGTTLSLRRSIREGSSTLPSGLERMLR